MKRNSIKILYFCLLFLVMPIIGSASDIEITSFESSIKLNKNRTANIREDYELYFINNAKSFDRTLDTTLELIRKKESKSVLKTLVTDIKSDSSYEIKDIEKEKTISLNIKGTKDTIGEANLSYTYDLGKENSRKYDEFYYNIISNFDNVVSDISFEIILPDDVNIKDIDFLLNNEYSLTTDDVTYDTEGNIITGYLNKMLNENDTFSIRLELPEGYFQNTRDNFNYFTYLFLILPFISLIVVTIYWFKYGKGNKAKRKFDLYPPNKFDSAEIGYLYKGKAEEADVISVIISLANKGYLQIEENDDGYKLGKDNSFNFIKLKNYKEKNAVQKILFKGIFKDREKSTLSDIEYTIMDRLMDAKSTLDNKNNKKKLFNININKVKLISMLLIILSVIVMTITPVKEMTNSYILVPVLSLTLIFGLAIIAVINTGIAPKIILGLIFVGGTNYLNIYSLIGQNKLLIIYIIGMTLILISTFIYTKLPVRTKFGNQKLGEVDGFRIELTTMNQNKLKEMLEQNSNYFYDMVPYAYVFGILDNWMNLGKGIITERPNWHLTVANEKFDLRKETKFFKNVIFTTTQVMIKGLYNKTEASQLEFKRDVFNSKLNE